MTPAEVEMTREIERLRDYLREKNELIKAYAGPIGMTPEDVAYALDDRRRLLILLEEFREAEEIKEAQPS